MANFVYISHVDTFVNMDNIVIVKNDDDMGMLIFFNDARKPLVIENMDAEEFMALKPWEKKD